MIKIGLLICCSDNYFAQEYKIPESYTKGVDTLAKQLDAQILPYAPVKDAEQTRAAKVFFTVQKVDYVLILCAAFSSGDIMMEFDGWPTPIGVWAAQEPKKSGDIQLNAVVSMNLFISIAQRSFLHKKRVKWFYGSPENKQFRQRFKVSVQALHGVQRMQTGRIGILGDVAPTFYNLEADRKTAAALGISFVSITMEEIQQVVNNLSAKEIENMEQAILTSAHDTKQLPEASLFAGAQVLAALCQLVDTYQIHALSACCWPDFQDMFSIVPCVPFTLLAQIKGVPVACEGDVGGAISLMLAHAVSGCLPTLMDVTEITPAENELLLWHCGIGSVELQSSKQSAIVAHPMLDRKNPGRVLMGLSYDYAFRAVPVTLLRYSNNHQLFAIDAAVSDKQAGFTGTRGHIGRFTRSATVYCVEDVFETLMSNGIEHHLIVCPTQIEQALKEVTALLDIPYIKMKQQEAAL
ncbi:MAG: hypothetical protein ACLTW1_20690 [[Clostridium] innocuum]